MKKLILLTGVVFMAYSCQNFNNTATFPEFVQWSVATANIDEDATEPITIEVQLVGTQKGSPIDISFEVTENNVAEGVNYTFPNGKTLTIDANSSTGTIQIATIDNEEIAPGEQSITLTLTSAGNLSVGDETSPNKSIKIIINENDFWCPRNNLAKVIALETDLGYSSSDVSITLSSTPDGCFAFSISGGGGSIFGTTDVTFGEITLIEDAPESNTGTIKDATGLEFTNLAGDSYGYTMDISSGTYDLSAGTFQFDYIFYRQDGTPWFPGTLVYTAN